MGKVVIPAIEKMDAALDALVLISNDLGAINRRLKKYLDGLEPPELVPVLPEIIVCGFCFQEIEDGDRIIECEHAHLCQACAPCDQCSLPGENL